MYLCFFVKLPLEASFTEKLRERQKAKAFFWKVEEGLGLGGTFGEWCAKKKRREEETRPAVQFDSNSLGEISPLCPFCILTCIFSQFVVLFTA